MCKYRHIEGGAVERNSRKIIQRLRKDGYVLVSIVGSHHKYSKGERTVIVPHPKKDLTEGTARSIAKQAGWI
jgi:predicted RNA binding protein YcfA (HicA-like mRNA interferase family)